MAKANLTAQRLRELLHYDPETGVFTWLSHRSSRCRAGHFAGAVNTTLGYQMVGVDGGRHYGHRLAWLHFYGVHPSHEIDHINGDRADNKIANLRDVPRNLNAQNMRAANSANTTGLLGVTRYINKKKCGAITKRWVATIKVSGKRTHLGVFDTPELAHQAYVTAKRMFHAGCTL